MQLAHLLLLADGRLPAGGHVHSGGVEAAIRDGVLSDIDDLHAFLDGRLASTGRTDASVSAWVTLEITNGRSNPDHFRVFDAEASARICSPALLTASRTRGRALLRVARTAWPEAAADLTHLKDPHVTVVMGAVGAAAGIPADAVAAANVHDAVAAPATAAVRLLGLDPIAVHALLVMLAPAMDRVASEAVAAAERGAPRAISSPLLDIRAERHANWEVRLFAS